VRQHSFAILSAVLAIVNPPVCPSVRPSVRCWHCVKTTPATIMRSSLEDSRMTLVSSWLTLLRNAKGNVGSEGAK